MALSVPGFCLAEPILLLETPEANLSQGMGWFLKTCKICDSVYSLYMKSEFTAIIESAPEGGYWGVCPEVPGANGQGETIEETKQNLVESIELILEDRRSDFLRGLPADAIRETVLVG